MSTLLGHFVSSPREREKRDRRDSRGDEREFVCLFVLFGLYVTFNNFSVISRRCLDVAGSSMLTFRVLPH